VVPRLLDKGADVLATFTVAGALRLRVAVQAKHFGTRAPVGREVVQQLLDGMEAEQADLGIVATSGVFSEDAAEFAAALMEAGTRVDLVDGEQLAAMIIDCGLGTVELTGE
jgi:restriction endonuclease Mrr